jgi:AraC-like DNA-binding protein
VERKRFSFRQSSPTLYLGGHPREPRELFVLCCGYDKCRPDYRVTRTNHPVYVAEYVMRGEGEFSAGGKTWRLHGGTVFVYGPGVPHTYRTDSRNTMEKLWIVYTGTQATPFTRKALGVTYGAFTMASPESVYSVFEAIATEIVNKGPHSQAICDGFIRALIPMVAANRTQATGYAAEALQTFQRCKSLIDERYTEMTSPFDICGHVKISPSYLCRLFKRYAGHSPAAYLTRLKLDAAAYMLVSSPMSIKEIAARLAYSDQYNFSRSYKRHFGVSPSHYRRGDTVPQPTASGRKAAPARD